MRPLLLLFLLACGDDATSACLAGDLSQSAYCPPEVGCITLADKSQGCLGSHTEQPCRSEGADYTRVGGDDAATLFFHADGTLAAVQSVGQGAGACEDAWFGLDLSGCVATGDEVQVPCDGGGE